MRHLSVAVAAALLLNAPQDTAVPQRTTDKDAVAKGNTQFAFDLYATLRDRGGNLFSSPYSVSTALALTHAGARGTTADQIARALHFALPPARLHPALGALMKEVNGGNAANYELYTVNALWGQTGDVFQDNFIAVNKEHYGAGLNHVDFARATENARKTINDWIKEQTHDKITDLLPRGALDDRTRLVLTNAVYFLGAWEQPFDPMSTRDGQFHVSDTTTVTVLMMHHDSNFRHMRNDDVIALDLPYKGRDLSMILLLPSEMRPLADLETRLTPDNLESWVRAMKPGRVMVTLPKFRVESQFSLRNALSTLGMPVGFSEGADLSGIAGRKNLYISDVVHKAFVDVNEVGTEAAAASGVVSVLTSAPPQFIADRPFVFVIRDNRNGTVLFMGRLTNPAS